MPTPMPATRNSQFVEVVTPGSIGRVRREWPDEFKAEMAARSLMPGVNSSALAREIGISPSQLYGWRKFATDRGLLHRLEVEPCDRAAGASASSAPIEIEITGIVIRCPKGFDEATLSRVIRTVRQA